MGWKIGLFISKAKFKLVVKALIITFVFGIGSYIMIPRTTALAYVYSTDSQSNKSLIKGKIFDALQNYNTVIRFTPNEVINWNIENKTKTDPVKVYYDLLFEQPEIFWTSLKVTWVKYDDGSYILYVNNLYENSDIDKKKLEIENKINEIINKFSTYDDLRKVYEIHDYINENCTYDYDTSNNPAPSTKLDPNVDFNKYIADDRAVAKANVSYFESHSIYGALIKGKAVCEGYSKLAKILFNKSGIESDVIRSDEHGWNYVKINGNYYQIDTTWDDINDEKNIYPYRFFNITNSQISQDKVSGEFYKAISDNVPNCTDSSFDNIFRTVSGDNLLWKDVVRSNDKLYGIDLNGNVYNLYCCNLDGTNKIVIKSNMSHAENVYAYNNKIYYYEYGIKDNKFYKNINEYDISIGKVTRFIDLVSEFGQPKGAFNISFYVNKNMMYVNLLDDNGEVTKTYLVLNEN